MPSVPYPISTRAKEKYIEAQKAFEENSFPKAIKLIKEVVTLEPTFKEAHDLWLVWSVDYAKMDLSPTEMEAMYDLYRKHFDEKGNPIAGSKGAKPLV